MLTHIPSMASQGELPLSVVFCFDRLQVRIQRCFDIHDDIPLVGHSNDHVRANDLIVAYAVDLFLEVAVLNHPGQFDEAAQGNFTPATAHLRTS